MTARYEVLGLLATGGMAEILRARAVTGPHAGRPVVLKRMLPHLAESPELRAAFQRETEIALRINHPNVVLVLDAIEYEGGPALVLEWLDGVDLRGVAGALEARGTRLHPAQATSVCARVARGLAHVHELVGDDGAPLGLVHRDVSPHNVFVTRDGGVKLLDFGIAKLRDVATRSGLVRGKPAYMAPEQIAGLAVEPRTDLFALGVVLWEMLAGRRLWAARGNDDDDEVARAIREESPPPLRIHVPEVSPELEALTGKLLAKFVGQRPVSAQSVANALERLAHEHGSRSPEVEIAGILKRVAPGGGPPLG